MEKRYRVKHGLKRLLFGFGVGIVIIVITINDRLVYFLRSTDGLKSFESLGLTI